MRKTGRHISRPFANTTFLPVSRSSVLLNHTHVLTHFSHARHPVHTEDRVPYQAAKNEITVKFKTKRNVYFQSKDVQGMSPKEHKILLPWCFPPPKPVAVPF